MKKPDKDDAAYAKKMAKMGKSKEKGSKNSNPFKNALASVKK